MTNHFMLKITLVIAALLQGVFLRAQDCDCYAPTRQTAVRMMEKKEYAKALKLLRAADACPDKPSDNDLADKMQECRRAIQRIEEEQRKAREGAAKGYMDILNVEFGNGDGDNNMLTPYGSTLYAQEIKFVKPRLRLNSLASEDKTVTLFVKIITPDGKLKRGSSSPEGFTFSDECTIKPGTNQMLALSGWGSKDGGTYQEGTHRFELYYNGRKLYAREFHIVKKETTPYLTVDGKTTVSTSFSADGGNETFYISTNAASWTYWGCPSWCTVSEKEEKSFKLVVEANPGSTERTDFMFVNAGGIDVRINIRQAGKGSLDNNLSMGIWKSLMRKVLDNATFTYDNGLYKGESNQGLRHGLGVYYWSSDNDFFWGEYSNGNTDGDVIYLLGDANYSVSNCPQCVYFVGKMSNSKKTGKGTCYDKYGRMIYYGDFSDDSPANYTTTPKGTMFKFECIKYAEGDLYVGETKDGKRHGMGIYLWNKGHAWFGNWRDNERDGYGIFLDYDGGVATGRWSGNTMQ